MWKKPTHGMVKVNLDASFHADTLSRASGAVVCDEHEYFIAGASWFVPHVRDVDASELQEIRNGMYLLASLGCRRAKVESDSSFAVDSVQLMDDYLGSEAAVVAECK